MDHVTNSLNSAVSLRAPQEGGDAAVEERLKRLEAQIEKQAEERQQMENRAAQQEKKIKKYESTWAKIKNSAQEKDKAKKAEKARGAADDASVGVPDIS